MSFGQSISTCFRKYAVFSGRATRPEFWYFVLFVMLLMMALTVMAVAVTTDTDPDEMPVAAVVVSLAWLALLLPYWAALVRRLHDTDRSGWFMFISLVPLVGWIILLVTLASRGTPGPNRYGVDPEGRSAVAPWVPSAPGRRCPFCAEAIQPEAIVCRWCGRDLQQGSTPTAAWTALTGGGAQGLGPTGHMFMAEVGIPTDGYHCKFCGTKLSGLGEMCGTCADRGRPWCKVCGRSRTEHLGR